MPCMKALPRLSALGFALALAGCDSGSDSKADAPPSVAEDADEEAGEKTARADEAEAADESKEAGADDSGGPDEDLYAPFVDESRRARRPDGPKPSKPSRPAPTKAPRADATEDKSPTSSQALSGDGSQPGGQRFIKTADGKSLKVTKGGKVSLDRPQARPR